MDENKAQLEAGRIEILRIEQAECKSKINSAANWFLWIAGLSLINTFLNYSETIGEKINFIAGLGITLLLDSEYLTGNSNSWALSAGFAIIFAIIGVLARKPSKMAFIVGLILYALDACIFIMIFQWKYLLFHGIAFYFILKGVLVFSEYRKINTELEQEKVKR